MKERGILYSAPMVRAKLAGTKTQTRRIIERVRGFAGHIRQFEQSTTPGYDFSFRDRRGLWQDFRRADFLKLCPYGQPGDRLWGRETYRRTCDNKSWACVQYRADESLRLMLCEENGEGDPIGTKPHKEPFQRLGKKGPPWTPSIYMPRWASRILDEIIEIRVERVQDITNADCIAEGIEPIGSERELGKCLGKVVKAQAGRLDNRYSTVRQLYSELWNLINGPGSWAANPWVWVIVTKPILPAPSAAGR